MKPARLIIVDDHQVVRRGLRSLIDRTPGLEVVAEGTDGVEAERLAREVPADLMILDIAMPGKGGLQVLESLRAGGSRLPVLLFSMHPASQYVDHARRNGARGFIGKDEDVDEIVQAIRHILAGGTRFPPPPEAGSAANAPFPPLSRREAEVMKGLLRGEALNDIAARLGVGAKSASTYRRRILDKLGLQNNAQLIEFALRQNKP